MNRLQWLAQAEISKLEEMFKQVALEEHELEAAIEELRAEVDRARNQRKRDRKRS